MRPRGRPNLSMEQIEVILTLSEDRSNNRREIADKAGCSKQCVYLYQKRYNLL